MKEMTELCRCSQQASAKRIMEMVNKQNEQQYKEWCETNGWEFVAHDVENISRGCVMMKHDDETFSVHEVYTWKLLDTFIDSRNDSDHCIVDVAIWDTLSSMLWALTGEAEMEEERRIVYTSLGSLERSS